MEVVKKESPTKINVGDTFETKQQGIVEVLHYNGTFNVGIRFLDTGYEYEVSANSLRNLRVKDPTAPWKTSVQKSYTDIIELGKEYTTKSGCVFIPTNYISVEAIEVEFKSGYKTTVSAANIRKGAIRDKLSPSCYGVGFVGDGEYIPAVGSVKSREYCLWLSMLTRVYDPKYHKDQPTYLSASVCTEWHNFQNFAEWCNTQHNFNFDGYVLDKDLLHKGNKHYSPSMCSFIPHEINSLLTKANIRRGDCPLGVSFVQSKGKFIATLSKYGKNHHLGQFDNKEAAFAVYKTEKERHIKVLADEYLHTLTVASYRALQNYVVEVTD